MHLSVLMLRKFLVGDSKRIAVVVKKLEKKTKLGFQTEVKIMNTNHHGIHQVFSRLVQKFETTPDIFFLQTNWKSKLASYSSFWDKLMGLRDLCIKTMIIFKEVKANLPTTNGKNIASTYQSRWTRFVGPITTYSHLLACHLYPLLDKGVNLDALCSESIEILNKKVNKIISTQTTNSRPIAHQLMRLANMKDAINLEQGEAI